MRSEQEMLDLILTTAKDDERIRAVIMNGSRVNPNVKRDIFQDFDIVYIVKNIQSFTTDHSWINVFGERMMMQMPEEKELPHPVNNGCFPYLMQFKDGNRIDLTLIPLEKVNELLQPDSLSLLLLDKDNIIGSLPPPNESDYHIKRPTEKEYIDSCNEFWWICTNICKGLWREELPYTLFMYEQINRNVLIKMLKWNIGIKTNFTKSAGNLGKYMKNFLEEEEWNQYEATYSDAKTENIWNSLFIMCELFRATAIKVGNHFDFTYPYQDDDNVTAHLKHVRNLSSEAQRIY